jgi:myo-inositol-1(or 4)-monophosphatase
MKVNTEGLIKQLVIQAGTLTAKKFGKVGIKYSKRDPGDVVTEADLAANRMIIKGIKSHYPDHDIISEEIPSDERKSNYVWIIDPLDGTRNFVSKTPLFCTMICLVKNDELQLSAIYDPIHKDLYFAKKGKGAFLNGKRMQCSETKQWKRSFGCGPVNMNAKKGVNKVMKRLITAGENETFWLSGLGSTGISMMAVASGKRDWGFSLSGEIWDYAPVFLILKEAGCK